MLSRKFIVQWHSFYKFIFEMIPKWYTYYVNYHAISSVDCYVKHGINVHKSKIGIHFDTVMIWRVKYTYTSIICINLIIQSISKNEVLILSPQYWLRNNLWLRNVCFPVKKYKYCKYIWFWHLTWYVIHISYIFSVWLLDMIIWITLLLGDNSRNISVNIILMVNVHKHGM